MKSILWVYSILFLWLFSCSKIPDSLIVVGEILGSDGKPPTLGHVNIVTAGQNIYAPKYFTEISKEGRFRLELKPGKYWMVTITAVNHPPVSFPLLLSDYKNPIQINIKLAASEIKTDLSDLQLIGSWNNWDFNTGLPLKPNSDGTYLYEGSCNADTFDYQIINYTIIDRSINGTQADYYRYDGGGDYISVVKTANQKVRIKFDPKFYPKYDSTRTPDIQFDELHTWNKDIAITYLEMEKIRRTERSKPISGLSLLSDDSLRKNLTDVYKKWATIKNNPEDSMLYKFISLKMAELNYLGVQSDSLFLKELVQSVPLSDTMWVFSPQLIVSLYQDVYGTAKAREILSKNSSAIPDRLAQALVLIDLGYKAKSEGNFEKQLEIHKILYYNFSDISIIRPFLYDIDPRKSNKTGVIIPPFHFPIFKSKKFVSDETMKGRYYLLVFWSIYQSDCISEMSYLHKAYEEFRNFNFQIIAFNFDPFPKDLEKFMQDNWDLPWINVQVPKYQQPQMISDYGTYFMPTLILVGPDKKTLALNYELRGPQLRETLKKFLLKKENI